MLISFHARAVSSPQCLALWRCLEISHSTIGLHITVPDRHSPFTLFLWQRPNTPQILLINSLGMWNSTFLNATRIMDLTFLLTDHVMTAHLPVKPPLQIGRVIPWAINKSNHFCFLFCDGVAQFGKETDRNSFTKTKAQLVSEGLMPKLLPW